MSENKGIVTKIVERIDEEKKTEIANNIGDAALIASQGLLGTLHGMVWGVDKVSAYIEEYCPQKLKGVPAEKIVQPAIEVAGPAVQALIFRGEKKELRELFGNLIASSMNADQKDEVHPSFVEVIKNMSADEARIMKVFVNRDTYPLIDLNAKKKGNMSRAKLISNFGHIGKIANCSSPEVSHNLENLDRLGLVHIDGGQFLTDKSQYIALENDPIILHHKGRIEKMEGREPTVHRKIVMRTDLGTRFIQCCVL